MDEDFRDVQKASGYIKTFGIILLVLVLLLIAGIAFLACKLLRILKPVPSVDEPVQPVAERQPESEPEEYSMGKEIEDMCQSRLSRHIITACIAS